MRMPVPTQTYATPANAEKKLAKHVNPDRVRWLIAVSPEGRYYPVVIYASCAASDVDPSALIHCGIQVVG